MNEKPQQRVILDTNIVVAYRYKFSQERKLFDAILKHHTMLFSHETFIELQDVFGRPKLDQYSSKKRRRAFVRKLRPMVPFVDVSCVVTDVRDPKDNKFIELALDGAADYLITADSDFLADPALLKKYSAVKICSADDAAPFFL